MTIQTAMTFCKPSMVIFLCLTCSRASVAQEPSTLEHVRAGGSAGLRKYTAGDWALMQSEVQNTGDAPAEVLSVIYFGDDSGIQFGRKAWIPAQSRRTFWIPVRVPEGLVSAEDGPANSTLRTSSLKTLLIDQTGGRERLLRMSSEGLFDARPFSIDVAPIRHGSHHGPGVRRRYGRRVRRCKNCRRSALDGWTEYRCRRDA